MNVTHLTQQHGLEIQTPIMMFHIDSMLYSASTLHLRLLNA
jgi:hypothetical protein